MPTCTTENVINELVVAVYGGQADARQRYVLKHALHGLVRQARAEQLQELRRDVWRATGIAQLAPDGSGTNFMAVPQTPHHGGHHSG